MDKVIEMDSYKKIKELFVMLKDEIFEENIWLV